MNALELHGVQKTYPDFTLGPIDLTLPGGTVCGSSARTVRARARP